MISGMRTNLGALIVAGLLVSTSAWAQLRVPEQQVRELSRVCTYGDCENGYGVLTIKTTLGEDSYRGNFADGEYHGNGKLTELVSVTQRAYYDGGWEHGVREGRGTYWNGKGNLYIGQWKSDKREGRGSYFFGVKDWTPNKYSEFWLAENVENYTGGFENDLYHGKGEYRWPDGQKYEGEFFANDKHGAGTFIYSTGSIRKQVWEYGRFIR